MRMLRRVVTGHNEAGKSIVVFDGPPTNLLPDRVAELWFTDETPASNRGNEDAALRPLRMEPPPRGSVFRYIQIPPESAAEDVRIAEAIQALDARHTLVDTSRHPGMHRTDTIDYVVVLSGMLTMLLDEGEVALKPFDIVVQRGTNHAWVNKGTEPALLLAVNLPAQ